MVIDFFNKLNLLLYDNNYKPISISINNNLSQISGKVISLYSLSQCMDIVRFNYKILRHEAFA